MVETAGASEVLSAVQPSFSHARAKVATICWVKNLLQTNRARLYTQVVDAVVAHNRSRAYETMLTAKIAFKVIRVPGDGRCGWRSILASEDVQSFAKIPRSSLGSVSIVFACFAPLKKIYDTFYVYVRSATPAGILLTTL